ncbi:MAG: hypothetical protein ACKO0Z_07630 [Betaproteobacteria bacterium]
MSNHYASQFQSMLKPSIVIDQVVVLPSGTHQQVYNRPLDSRISESESSSVVSLLAQSGHAISPAQLTSAAPNLLTPQSQVGAIITVPNGFLTKRYLWTIRGRITTAGNTENFIATGYTDDDDLTLKRHIAPEQRLNPNGIWTVSSYTVLGGATYQGQAAGSASLHGGLVIDRQQFSSSGADRVHLITPDGILDQNTAVISDFMRATNGTAQTASQVALAASTVHAHTAVPNIGFTKAINTLSQQSVVNASWDSGQDAFSATKNELPSSVSALSTSALIHALRRDNMTIPSTAGYFYFSDLLPYIVGRNVLAIHDGADVLAHVSNAGNSCDWTGAGTSPVIAALAQRCTTDLLNIMHANGIAATGFVATNKTLGGDVNIAETIVTALICQSDNTAVMHARSRLFAAFTKLVFPYLSNGGMLVEVNVRQAVIATDVHIYIKIDGVGDGEFIFPSFVGGAALPIITPDAARAETSRCNLSTLFGMIAESNGVSSASAGFSGILNDYTELNPAPQQAPQQASFVSVGQMFNPVHVPNVAPVQPVTPASTVTLSALGLGVSPDPVSGQLPTMSPAEPVAHSDTISKLFG